MLPPEKGLQVEGLRAGYGPVEVIRDLSLTARCGELIGLAGRNGAGKTTTLRALSGLVARRAGTVRLDGRPIAAVPSIAARSGLAHVPEGRGLMPSLTVLDNLRVAAFAARRDLTADDIAQLVAIFPLLRDLLPRIAGSLSGGQQQVVALSRVLAAKPLVLLIDELSLGLAPRITSELWRALVELAGQRDLAIVVVDQNLRLMREHCSRIYWLNEGVAREVDFGREDAEQKLQSIYFD